MPQDPRACYEPTPDERALQDFVLGLKLLANGPMQARVREAHGREADGATLEHAHEFRAWAVLAHHSQTMMWRAVEPTARRAAGAAVQILETLQDSPGRSGGLTLEPSCEIPDPVATVEIHRQPGGYVVDRSPTDMIAAMRYLGSSLIYAAGKGSGTAGTDERGRFIVDQIRAHFGQIAPRRILDIGCGIGITSQAIAHAFPDADFHAIDVAPGLLRFAHLFAAQCNTPIYFRQRDAAETGFPDAHFDLIVSNIVFHETSDQKLPAILRECHRLLADGGCMLHLDVATQLSRVSAPDQAMNAWQASWNGEPYWSGYSRRDLRADVIDAGFPAEHAFAKYAPRPGGGVWYLFGGRR